MSELTAIKREAGEARRRLQVGCTDPKIRGAISINGIKLSALEPKIEDVRGRVQRLEAMLAAELRRPAPVSAKKWLAKEEGFGGQPTTVSNLPVRLEQAAAELGKLEAEKAELVAESERLWESMIWV